MAWPGLEHQRLGGPGQQGLGRLDYILQGQRMQEKGQVKQEK